jgi:hypothetical protein
MKNNFLQISTVIVVSILLVLLTDPFMVLMPSMTQMIVLVLATVAVALWGGFIATEDATDEREVLHRMHAGRAAYLAGLAILVLALLEQGLDHHIDPWIPLTLGVMIVVKLLARLYEERYR